MTARSLISGANRAAADSGQKAHGPLLTVCAYVALSVALDRISLVHVLPESGFTLWNPVPACGLALLLTKGLRFAPALFVAGALADGINGDFYSGVVPTFVTNAIMAAGYTAVAAALRRFGLAPQGFRALSDTCWLLAVVAVGILALALLTVAALALLRALAPDQIWATAFHFWVGDLTGVVGLFPALVAAPRAWARWRELPVRARLLDPAVFALILSAHDQINNLFRLCRDHVSSTQCRALRTQAFHVWAEVSGVAAAA